MIDTRARMLILGGARSGKSRRAEELAETWPHDVAYVATARRFEEDAEWDARIEAHRARRPARWGTHEVPLDLPEALLDLSKPNRLMLVDCLTLWLSNCLLETGAGRDAALVNALALARGPVVLVSNEVGLGVVPENALARRFRDAQGRLNVEVAAVCSHVELVVAGIPMVVKGES